MRARSMLWFVPTAPRSVSSCATLDLIGDSSGSILAPAMVSSLPLLGRQCMPKTEAAAAYIDMFGFVEEWLSQVDVRMQMST